MIGVRHHPSALTRGQCAAIVAGCTKWERDPLKKDIAHQSVFFDKEMLDDNTVVRTLEDSSYLRMVDQCPINPPTFPIWDDKPVYRCKVMRYGVGDFVAEHHDAIWMCLSNYWEPDSNLVSHSLTSIVLNDDFEGGEFTVEGGRVIEQRVGDAIHIPQHALDKSRAMRHGVNPVTKGTRYALVFWNFFRDESCE